VRIDGAPTCDAPPDVATLFREAARNHQLEQTYQDERRNATAKRRIRRRAANGAGSDLPAGLDTNGRSSTRHSHRPAAPSRPTAAA
jgi:hypothetical protein